MNKNKIIVNSNSRDGLLNAKETQKGGAVPYSEFARCHHLN